MKKSTLIAAIAVAGFMGLNVRGASGGFQSTSPGNGFTSVNVQLTILIQTNDTETGHTNNPVTHYNVTKIKVTSKDILNRIADEFQTNFPSGVRLVVNNFSDGQFSVLDKKGNVLLANVNTNVNAGDLYELNFYNHNAVFTGKATDTMSTLNFTMVREFYYQDAQGTNSIDVYGLTTVKQRFNQNNIGSESYKIANGDGYFNGDNDGENSGVIMGTVSGSGKNILVIGPQGDLGLDASGGFQ